MGGGGAGLVEGAWACGGGLLGPKEDQRVQRGFLTMCLHFVAAFFFWCAPPAVLRCALIRNANEKKGGAPQRGGIRVIMGSVGGKWGNWRK